MKRGLRVDMTIKEFKADQLIEFGMVTQPWRMARKKWIKKGQ